MSDIFREVDEDLRRDRLEKVWKQYGAAIVGAVLVIVAGTAGFVAWRNHQHAEAEAQTAKFADALRLAGNQPGQGANGGGDPKAAADALSAFAGQSAAGPGTSPASSKRGCAPVKAIRRRRSRSTTSWRSHPAWSPHIAILQPYCR